METAVMLRPILLEEAFGKHEWVQELYRFNVRFVEQLGAMLVTFTGRTALSHLKDVPANIAEVQTRVNSLLIEYHGISLAAPRAFSSRTGMSLLPERSHGLGYKLPPDMQNIRFGEVMPPVSVVPPTVPSTQPPVPASVVENIRFGGVMPSVPVVPPTVPPTQLSVPASMAIPSVTTLPPNCDLDSLLTGVRDQYFRGTCVAFATVALQEAEIFRNTGQFVDLSEQYVYFVARQNDPDRREDGTYPRYALDAMQQRGACRRVLWPYNEFNDWGQAFLFHNHTDPLSALDADAKNYRIPGYKQLNPKSVSDIKQALLTQRLVCVGLPVFQQAWHNGFTESTGEIEMPLTRINPDGSETLLDTVVGGHAIAIAGYMDTSNPNDPIKYRPGGGYLIFKNSWGTSWGNNSNEHKPGFGLLPYAYLEKYNLDASVII